MAAQQLPDKPHLVLTYLDIKGFAEPIRLTLAIGQVQFEDHRVSYEEIKRMRSEGELPFGQVPVLDIDGVRHSQSRALLRWAGKQSGLYPTADRDWQLQLHIDAVLDTITDIQTTLMPAWYHHACSRSPITGDFFSATKLNEEQVAGVFEALSKEILPARFQQLERVLAAWEERSRERGGGVGPYFCGDVLTIADVNVYVLISGLLDGTYVEGLKRGAGGVVADCTRLHRLVEAVAAHPEVKRWEGRGGVIS